MKNREYEALELLAESKYGKTFESLTAQQLHFVAASFVMAKIGRAWQESKKKHLSGRCAYYFSAEFLMGRMIYNNLFCSGLLENVRELLKNFNMDLSVFEEAEDSALGNGGLGRLAACFLDSGATLGLPLDGYGIRYKYGLFEQRIEEGFQTEYVDDWTKYGDPWSVRREEDTVTVEIEHVRIKAVPYDMAVIGYESENIGTLRLWQAEPQEAFDFYEFNDQQYEKSLRLKNKAENISRVLYPNDSSDEGKKLRFSQQYFFSSASLQDIIRNFKKHHGDDFSKFSEKVAIQLNDTHPVISIPELIRLLTEQEGLSFEAALQIAKDVFCYTNHTVLPEALEKWSVPLIQETAPKLMTIIEKIDALMKQKVRDLPFPQQQKDLCFIIKDKTVHMAYLACYVCRYINGVAKLHTEILKSSVLKQWYDLYPKKFQNKTNGITPRRWLRLCNPGLSELITELTGDQHWIRDLSEIKKLRQFADDEQVLNRLQQIKDENKRMLADHIYRKEGIRINPQSIYDIQIKRLHEYKRQFLNALSILEIYYEIKDGTLKDFYPTTFIFGAKAAPGYKRAKGIIKLINEIGRLIEADKEVNSLIKVIFVSNYNVSYAEKLVAAANVSEQISTAGTEASGTGNMKLALNGAVTLGTLDGANIEIVEEAGSENNYIFGAEASEIEKIKNSYNPKEIYRKNPKIKRVMDALIDGTLDDGKTGIFQELYASVLKGTTWHNADQYFILYDFEDYINKKIALNRDYRDRISFTRKCLMNIAGSTKFSSDRTVREYAKEIWKIQ